MKYREFIRKTADHHISFHMSNGYAAAGKNGPYGDNDTAMRNTAHWICIYQYLFNSFKDQKYHDVIEVLGAYLLNDENYGVEDIPVCRLGNRYDSTNGLIGLAWVIEGLIAAYQITDDQRYLNKAKQVFMSQKYIEDLHVWSVIDVDGIDKGIDGVYNHQLWYAAAGSRILDCCECANIDARIRDFLKCADRMFLTHSSGLAYHRANFHKRLKGKAKYFARKWLGEIANYLRISKIKYASRYLEKGYHLFDLYGFALLHERYSDMPIYRSKKMARALAYSRSNAYLNGLMVPDRFDVVGMKSVSTFNKYAYGYNSPAFEYGYVQKVLSGNEDNTVVEKMFSYQVENTYDDNCGMFSKNVYDAQTLTARLYEFCRYLELSDT